MLPNILKPLIFLVLCATFQTACTQQLKQIQKGTANHQIPVTNGKQYTLVYRDAIPYILDTLGIRDSIILTGSGSVVSIATAAPITGGTITTTGTIGITQSGTSSNGYLSSTDWNIFNSKEPAISAGTTAQYWRGDKTWQTLNTSAVAEGSNLYYTDARSRGAISLTTSGSSGASTYNSTTGVLNIPNYTEVDGDINNEKISDLTINHDVGNSLPKVKITEGGTLWSQTIPFFSTSTLNGGVVPGSNGSSTSFLRGDGTWQSISIPSQTRLQVGGIYYSGDLTLGTRNNGTYPAWAYSGGTIYYDLPAGSSGQVLKHNGVGWTAGSDNNSGMASWNFSVNGGSAYVMGNGFNMDFQNGSGISWSRSGQYLTATNTAPFSYIGLQAGAGAIGTLTNTATLNLTGTGGTTVTRSGNTFTINSTAAGTQNLIYGTKSGTDIPLDISSGVGVIFREGTGISLGRTASNVMTLNSTVVNTDNQTLSFSSPNLSISGGNSVALPVLPTGTATNNTLRWNGSSWVESSLLQTGTARVDINSWPGTINLGSRLLVNGHIQYTNTGFSAASITGRDSDGGLTSVGVGSGLSLSSGTLSATDNSSTNEIQSFLHGGTGSYTGTLNPSSGGTAARFLINTSGKMLLDHNGSGIITLSTDDSFAEVFGTPVSSLNNSTYTTASFSHPTYTQSSGNITAGSSGITINVSGRYRVSYNVQVEHSSASGSGFSGCIVSAYAQGGLKYTTQQTVPHNSGDSGFIQTVSYDFTENINQGTTINLWVKQSSTTGISTATLSKCNLIVQKL